MAIAGPVLLLDIYLQLGKAGCEDVGQSMINKCLREEPDLHSRIMQSSKSN